MDRVSRWDGETNEVNLSAVPPWQGEEQEKNQREALHGEKIDRPWTEVVDERGIMWNVGCECEVGFQEIIDDQRGGLVADGNHQHDDG